MQYSFYIQPFYLYYNRLTYLSKWGFLFYILISILNVFYISSYQNKSLKKNISIIFLMQDIVFFLPALSITSFGYRIKNYLFFINLNCKIVYIYLKSQIILLIKLNFLNLVSYATIISFNVIDVKKRLQLLTNKN